jgi:hypothetical protein
MTNGFTQRVTTIKGLSDRRRLPRIGRIRLGLKAVTTSGKEYPKEVEYFVVPDEVKKVYGDKPMELDVMFPLNDMGSVFPVAYKSYGSGKGLRCTGDGETAHRVNETTKEMEQIKCPCNLLEDKKCKQTGTLMVMLPRVSVGGIYQCTTSSINSIIDIASCLDYVSALIGRFAMVPLKLRRVKTETHHDDKKQNHYTLQVIFDGDISTINALRGDTLRVLEHPRFQLPAPLDENPELDAIDIVADEEKDIPDKTYVIEPEKMPPPEPPPAPPRDKKAKPKGRDLGMAIICPDRENGKQIRPKKDCDTCDKREGCPAWE